MITIPRCKNEKVPAPEIEFNHRVEIQTRFTDIDMFGHVNNGAFMAYLDYAKTRYMADVTGRDVNPKNIAAVIVNINCNFYSPGYIEEPLSVVTAVSHFGERSFVIDQRIYNRETGDVKVIARSILAGFNPVTAQGEPLPADFVAAVKQFEKMQ